MCSSTKASTSSESDRWYLSPHIQSHSFKHTTLKLAIFVLKRGKRQGIHFCTKESIAALYFFFIKCFVDMVIPNETKLSHLPHTVTIETGRLQKTMIDEKSGVVASTSALVEAMSSTL